MTARRLTTFYSTAWRNHELSYRPSHAPEHTARGMTAIADSWYNPEGYTGKQDMTRSSVFTTNHAGRVAAVAGRALSCNQNAPIRCEGAVGIERHQSDGSFRPSCAFT